jgi:hypothetical protein
MVTCVKYQKNTIYTLRDVFDSIEGIEIAIYSTKDDTKGNVHQANLLWNNMAGMLQAANVTPFEVERFNALMTR